MASLAIDFGGTQVKFGLIDQEGVVLCAAKVDSTANETIAFNLELISQKIRELMESKGIDARNVTSIGIALPSIINSKENIVLSEYVKYTDANTFDFNRWALEEWSVPVILENDARAALVGEWKFGAGKEYANIVLLTLGTGVGSRGTTGTGTAAGTADCAASKNGPATSIPSIVTLSPLPLVR